MDKMLMERSGGKCELSQKSGELVQYTVLPDIGKENLVILEHSISSQIESKDELDPAEWRFLTDSMWSEIPAIQVLSWRMLNRLKNESWAAEALDILYLDEETLEWAKSGAGQPDTDNDPEIIHKDAFGNILQNGDSVVVMKTLDVKGSSISAKQGTVVRNIRLVPDNEEQIEGRVGGQLIVILTKFLRKN